MAALDWFESILAEGVRIEKIRQNLALLESNIAPHGQGFEPMGHGGGGSDAMVGMAMLSARLGELRPWPKSVCVMPDSIRVVRGRTGEERYYFPERKARKVTVWTHDTDHATGHTECSECKGSINPSAKWCEHCGAKFEG